MSRDKLHPVSWMAILALGGFELFILDPLHVLVLGAGAVTAYIMTSSVRSQAVRRIVLLFLPIAIASGAVQFAGAATPHEAVWIRLSFAALGPERTEVLAMIWGRMAAILGGGLYIAERARAAPVRRFAADLRLPAGTARVLLSSLAFFRLVEQTASQVAQAQALRGLSVHGSIATRVRALPYLIMPLMAGLFTEAAHRSAALERRGFATYTGDLPKPRPITGIDMLIIVSCVAGATLQLMA